MKNYETIEHINQQIQENALAVVQKADEAFIEQLQGIIQQILTRADEAPIILLAGPSGSGKTTTAYILADLLRQQGKITHSLSLDNYFRTITPEERASGTIDLESPERVDCALLNNQLQAMLRGEPVQLPHYDFNRTTNYLTDEILHRKPGELILLEGIHALNPEVIQLPEHQRQTIYISVHTHLFCDKQKNPLHPMYIRLLRRMIRDKQFRSRSIEETLWLFPKVEAGKQRFIKPYRRYADYEIDTFIPYEVGIYRLHLLETLKALDAHEQNHRKEIEHLLEHIQKTGLSDEKMLDTARQAQSFLRNEDNLFFWDTISCLLNLLCDAKSVNPNMIPNTSLIQEFLGNSIYFNN